MCSSKPEKDLYSLGLKAMWQGFWQEHFCFWMLCAYLFVEYVRPQSIYPALDILPWASVFTAFAFVGAILDPSVKWVKSPANKWMILFFCAILASSWMGSFPSRSFNYLIYFYTWLIVYFLVGSIVNSRQRLFIFLTIFFLASFKISFGLAMQWARRGFSFTTWGLMGPPGFFENSGELAIQMAVFFPLAFVVASELHVHISRLKQGVLWMMPLTAVMTVLGSSTRGGQLALLAQFLLLFWRRIFRLKTLVIICIIGFMAFFFVPDEQKQRFSEAGNDKSSRQRLLYWEKGFEMLNDHPVLGVGYFNFIPYLERHYPEAMLYSHAELPHNIFIQVGADLGYVGLIFYLMLIKCGFINVKQLRFSVDAEGQFWRRLCWALNISFVGFLVAGQFVSVVYYPFMWIHLAMVSCARSLFSQEKRNGN